MKFETPPESAPGNIDNSAQNQAEEQRTAEQLDANENAGLEKEVTLSQERIDYLIERYKDSHFQLPRIIEGDTPEWLMEKYVQMDRLDKQLQELKETTEQKRRSEASNKRIDEWLERWYPEEKQGFFQKIKEFLDNGGSLDETTIDMLNNMSGRL